MCFVYLIIIYFAIIQDVLVRAEAYIHPLLAHPPLARPYRSALLVQGKRQGGI